MNPAKTARNAVAVVCLVGTVLGGGSVAGASHAESGYLMLSGDGRVYAFGGAQHLGEHMAFPTSARTDIEATPSGNGYWVLQRTASVQSFGDAPTFVGIEPPPPLDYYVSMSRTPTGAGLWLFTSRGRVVALGDARHFGDLRGLALNGAILDSVSTPTGNGYWMVAADGGVFSFGDAAFYGSMGDVALNAPVTSLAPDPDGAGYWLVASDGGIFSFDAEFYGSMGGVALNRPITGMVAQSGGYLMVGEDGGIFTFGSVDFHGSLGDNPPQSPITAVSAIRRPGVKQLARVAEASGTVNADTPSFLLTTEPAVLNYSCGSADGSRGAGCVFTIHEHPSGRQVAFTAHEGAGQGSFAFRPRYPGPHYIRVQEFFPAPTWTVSVDQERCVSDCS